MDTFIIYGADTDSLNTYIESYTLKHHIHFMDQIILRKTDTSIGISDVKFFIDQIKYIPRLSEFKMAIIYEANLLTPEAQNSLLKTLEEPPPKTKIFLVCESKSQLIETVLSRSEQIKLTFQNNPKIDNKDLTEMIESIINSKRNISNLTRNLKSKEDALNLTDQAIIFLYNKICQSNSDPKVLIIIIKKLIKIKQMLLLNVNFKLALTELEVPYFKDYGH
jgi:DNA polymerase III gamma/tau subunit